MERSGAAAYVYAKASGMLGKAFIGPRSRKLFAATSLDELWTLVFKTEAPLVPQVMLAARIEEEAERSLIAQYGSLIDAYDKPEKLLTELLYFYDIENLKEIGAALCAKEEAMPRVARLGKRSLINIDAWPDIARITRGSPFEWYNKVPEAREQQKMEMRLDNQYTRMIWEAANEVKGAAREGIVNFFRDDFEMTNVIWALRLKIYYEMSDDDIIARLSCAGKEPSRDDPLCGEAVAILGKAVDNYSDWQGWKRADFLNPREDGSFWRVDPAWIENVHKTRVFKAALRGFHSNPFTIQPLVAWFKIKQRECDIIRTAAESIRLSVGQNEALSLAGLQ